eukprot:scaffold130224_cov32-Tisochrysis_lutea.AAC.4
MPALSYTDTPLPESGREQPAMCPERTGEAVIRGEVAASCLPKKVSRHVWRASDIDARTSCARLAFLENALDLRTPAVYARRLDGRLVTVTVHLARRGGTKHQSGALERAAEVHGAGGRRVAQERGGSMRACAVAEHRGLGTLTSLARAHLGGGQHERLGGGGGVRDADSLCDRMLHRGGKEARGRAYGGSKGLGSMARAGGGM